MKPAPLRPVALTIAGFDPSSGAGITADLATFEANGCFGISAITALTVQSTTGVRAVQGTPPAFLAETLRVLEEDLPPDGIKIGMLADESNVRVVAEFVQELRQRRRALQVVLDPVLVSTSGRALLSDRGLQVLQQDLLPLVDVVTPNTDELTVLSGLACHDDESLGIAMKSLAARYPSLAVVATGGHRAVPVDTVLHDGTITMLPGQRIATRATHGTGCAYSSALLAALLRGSGLMAAATAAKRFVEGGMLHAEQRGAGHGPMRLLWPLTHAEGDKKA